MTNCIFHKMHGCGNDFVFIDNRGIRVPLERMAHWARLVCDRKHGVGADGLLFLENPPEGEHRLPRPAFIWHFYNADGSRGEMCGNASRCAAWLAVDLGMAGPEHCFGTDAGIIRASVDVAACRAQVELTRPTGLRLNITVTLPADADGSEEAFTVHVVNTGVPHAVIFFSDARQADVARLGPLLRRHPAFGPAGTNVNFVTAQKRDALLVRTFERGVEGETLACGTGAAASAVVAHALGLTDSRVSVTTSGGELLGMELRDGTPFLSGPAERVFSGLPDARFLARLNQPA